MEYLSSKLDDENCNIIVLWSTWQGRYTTIAAKASTKPFISINQDQQQDLYECHYEKYFAQRIRVKEGVAVATHAVHAVEVQGEQRLDQVHDGATLLSPSFF